MVLKQRMASVGFPNPFPTGDRNRDKGRYLPGFFCLLALLLSGCGNANLLEPIGIGPDRDELKRSPCACYEVPLSFFAWTLS
jgi:hypothetical protein